MAEYKTKTVQELIGTGDTWMSQLFQGVKAYTTMMNTINMTKWNEEAKTEQAEKYSLDRLQNLRLQFAKHKDNKALLMQDFAQWEAYGKTKFVSPLIIEQYIDGSQDFETYHARLNSQDAYDKWVNKQTNGGNDVTMIENYFKLDSEGFQAKLEKDRSELNEWRETYKRNGWLDETTKTMFNNHGKYLDVINVLGGHDNHIQVGQEYTMRGLWKDFLADGKVPNLAVKLNQLNTHVISLENRIKVNVGLQDAAESRRDMYTNGAWSQYDDAAEGAKNAQAEWDRLGVLIQRDEEKLVASHRQQAEGVFEKEFDWGGHGYQKFDDERGDEFIVERQKLGDDGVLYNVTINAATGTVQWGNPVKDKDGEGDGSSTTTPASSSNVTTPKGNYEHHVVVSDDGTKYWEVIGQYNADTDSLVEVSRQEITHDQRNELADMHGINKDTGVVESWDGTEKFTVLSKKKNPNKSGDVLFKDLSQSEKDKVIAAHRDAINNDIYNYKLSSMSPQKWYNSKIESGKEEVKPSLKKKVTKKKKSGRTWETAQKSISMWKGIITNINNSKRTAEQKEKDIAKYQAKIDAKLEKFE
jgi:hypothetical protein